MDANRRSFFARLTALAAGAKSLASAQARPETEPFLPVHTPDLAKLPFKVVDGGVKEFHLIAEVVETRLVPERAMTAWGYNGSVPGPTIEVQEGDRVRIVFENRLPEPTTPHWHGLEIPIEMDGVPGVTQDPVMPGGKFVYEFTLHQNGTFFYHSHMPMQEMMGMLGLFIVHPKRPHEPRVDRDFALVLQQWALLPNNNVPNTLAMEFNWLTFNGKTGPATTPVLVKQGERVRIRLVNLGMDHHPIHLHGHQFVVTGSEGGRQPESTWAPGNTVIVGVAQARDVEFVAKYVGDWMVHCHMPHHNMNQMVSMVGPMMSMGQGLATGASMTDGMGMIGGGVHALSDDLGPALGRGLGFAADADRRTSHLVAQAAPAAHQHHTPAAAPAPSGPEDPLTVMYPKDDPEKKKIAGYPQDMWMVMDEMYKSKPETYGLRPGWTGGMMGMMTLVRVLPPAKFDEIMARMPASARQQESAHGQQSPPPPVAAPAKPAGKTMTGRVEAVSTGAARLTVSHGTVPGWMNAMTMAYPVDNPDLLKTIKPGDRISATVFDGDIKLYDVKVIPGGGKQ